MKYIYLMNNEGRFESARAYRLKADAIKEARQQLTKDTGKPAPSAQTIARKISAKGYWSAWLDVGENLSVTIYRYILR